MRENRAGRGLACGELRGGLTRSGTGASSWKDEAACSCGAPRGSQRERSSVWSGRCLGSWRRGAASALPPFGGGRRLRTAVGRIAEQSSRDRLFLSVCFLPPPQNKTAHSSCSECRPHRKARSFSFLFLIKSPFIHHTSVCLHL